MLELKDVRFSVTDEKGQLKNIINGINLKIDEGKFVAITGPNGSGKSTLAKLIVGIIKPTSGQILYNGQDITEMSITDRAKLGISFAFQQPVRFKGIKVLDLLRIAAGKQLTISEACEYLSEVGLCARDYNRDVHTFIFCSRLNININAVFVFFSYNIYICSCISAILFAICPDIISTGRNLM